MCVIDLTLENHGFCVPWFLSELPNFKRCSLARPLVAFAISGSGQLHTLLELVLPGALSGQLWKSRVLLWSCFCRRPTFACAWKVEGAGATWSRIKSTHYVEFVNKSQIAHKGKCILRCLFVLTCPLRVCLLLWETISRTVLSSELFQPASWMNHRLNLSSTQPSNFTPENQGLTCPSSCPCDVRARNSGSPSILISSCP